MCASLLLKADFAANVVRLMAPDPSSRIWARAVALRTAQAQRGVSYLGGNDASVARQLFDHFTFLFGQQPFDPFEVQLKPC